MKASALRRPAATSSLFSRPSDLKLGLRVDESEHVAIGEVLAGGQAAAEVDQRRALHQGVVDVEECRRGQVDGRLLRAGGVVGLDVFQRPLGAGVGGQRLELLLSRVGFCVGAGFDSARAAGSGHGSTLSGRGALGWSAERSMRATARNLARRGSVATQEVMLSATSASAASPSGRSGYPSKTRKLPGVTGVSRLLQVFGSAGHLVHACGKILRIRLPRPCR